MNEMKSLKVSTILRSVILLAIITFCLMQIWSLTMSMQSKNRTLILYHNHSITYEQAMDLWNRNLEQENPLLLTLWSSIEDQSITNVSLNQSVQTDIIYIIGNSNLLFSSESSLARFDSHGILLSQDVAYRLFGSLNIIGQSVIYQGLSYVVRGVLTGIDSTIVLQASRYTSPEIRIANIVIPDDQNQMEVIEQFNRDFWMADCVEDVRLLVSIGTLALYILLFTIGVIIFMKAMRHLIRKKKYPCKMIVSILAITIGTIGFIYKLSLFPPVGIEFSFNMWSDVAYFERFASHVRSTIIEFLRGDWSSITGTYVRIVVMIYGYVLLGGISLFMLGCRKYID